MVLNINDFPNEILFKILVNVEPSFLLHLPNVCQRWKFIYEDYHFIEKYHRIHKNKLLYYPIFTKSTLDDDDPEYSDPFTPQYHNLDPFEDIPITFEKPEWYNLDVELAYQNIKKLRKEDPCIRRLPFEDVEDLGPIHIPQLDKKKLHTSLEHLVDSYKKEQP